MKNSIFYISESLDSYLESVVPI